MCSTSSPIRHRGVAWNIDQSFRVSLDGATTARRTAARPTPTTTSADAGPDLQVRPPPKPPPAAAAPSPAATSFMVFSTGSIGSERPGPANHQAAAGAYKTKGNARHGDGPHRYVGSGELHMALSLRRRQRGQGRAGFVRRAGDSDRGRPSGEEASRWFRRPDGVREHRNAASRS